MSTDISIRRLLACLNISVFDPAMEPALKKVCQAEEKLEADQRDPYRRIMPQAGMILCAFICFWGLRPYALIAGISLFLICGVALRKAKSRAVRYFFRTYFLTGLLLLTEICFSFSAAAVVFLLFVFLLRSLFSSSGYWQRSVLSVLFFGTACLAARGYQAVSLGLFSLAGTAGFLWPLKNVYSSETGVVFTVFPLVALLAGEALTLAGFPDLLPDSGILCAFFTAELLMLFCCLRRDLETEEIFKYIAGVFLLFLCGFFLSAGMEGCAALFLTAYFTDRSALGKTAAVLFPCFLAIFLLSLPVSLFSAGVISLGVCVLSEYARHQLKRTGKGGTRK